MNREKTETHRTSMGYFQQLCDSAGLAVLGIDRQLNVFYSNRQAAGLFGENKDGSVGAPVDQVVGRAAGAVIERLAGQAIESGECAADELRIVGTDGTDRSLVATVSPMCDERGRIIGASACFTDITHCLRVQHRIGQERKMHALGAMAGNLAHHFNNILGGVVTSVDFAKHSDDVRVLKRTLHAAADSLQRATRLLDELLIFAEADHRDTDLADLTETILHFVNDIEPQLVQRGLELDLRLSRLPVLEVPRQQLLTVLGNVASNAMEAMPDEGRMVLELRHETEQAVCRISDTGRGIDKQDLEHVFEPFYSTKSRAAGGPTGLHRGLGLPVARGIVHEIGGEITITSSPTDSTVVEIRLPLNPSKPVRIGGVEVQHPAIRAGAG